VARQVLAVVAVEARRGQRPESPERRGHVRIARQGRELGEAAPREVAREPGEQAHGTACASTGVPGLARARPPQSSSWRSR
jgi:hypothetical protein